MEHSPARSPATFSLPLRAAQPLPVRSTVDRELDPHSLQELIERLDSVRIHAGQVEERCDRHVREADPRFRRSARNLLHYLALRRFDLRGMQGSLGAMGLCSLGGTEAHTLASLYAVRRALERAAGIPVTQHLEPAPGVEFHQGIELLAVNAHALLGPEPAGRTVRIMVTLPADAADDYPLVRDLVAYGMDCARINCAHEGPEAWERMVANIHRANRELCEDCQIFMDLAGPKIRTGPLEPGPRVVTWTPHVDARGRVTAPARIWLAPPKTRPPEGMAADAVVPVPADWIASIRTGDIVDFADTRSERQELRIVGRAEGGCWAEAWQSAYVETGMELGLRRAGDEETEQIATARVGKLATVEVPIILEEGDTLILHRDPRPGAPTVRGTDGRVSALAHVACAMPEVFADVTVGESIAFDDGKMAGVIRSASPDEMRIEITVAKPGGAKLRADKGINFPDTELGVSAITPKDLTDLDFVVQHANTVGMSFVNDPADVERLQRELQARGSAHLGIVLKIETKRGFAQLPSLLLTAMRSYPVGVMIARGDLAVECGWERLAECQEEILWLCEAAHIPVIWATQVLETLAKKGLPSRAEITDAAMAERAECVMLNKGPYITRAVTSLDHILRRMQEHLDKKTPRLRRLTLAEEL